ncbi:hypothetical protein ACOJFZ_003907 [Salmonella enterica subsp. enterica serovar Montevideo]|uniref:hypothetical protein n=1 Tax=Escherichia coli TaxID=562 RepID=UPI0005442FF0|nr:hypothetical protein [Escherichia coli]EAC1354559.1 hypothetical protein [Salmonella enterica subsp. enterica serovar Montevideo]EAW6317840.1 hypothetical protein [Salmonella enterica]EFO0323747.1 hypothetical protein [Escherichia albertii]EFW3274796.1 hypothetical protein [Shigella flexneri]EMC9113146.1 hypothetical protein [Shigella sonnei]
MELLISPKRLCLYNDSDRRVTAKFLNSVDNTLARASGQVVIDFSTVEYAGAAASVRLFAIISRAYFMAFGTSSLRFIWPKKENNPYGHRYIVGTGLSIALMANTVDKLDVLTKERRYFQSAVEPYEHWAKTMEFIDSKAILTFEQYLLVSSALSEAMLNVSYHAYEHPDFAGAIEHMQGKRWWQSCWYNPDTDKVVFIIYDLGLGIHKSFTSASPLFTGYDDVTSVSTALTGGQSRYVNAGRGNGSEDIKRPIGSGCANSESLLVFTGNVKYSYNSRNEVPKCEWIPEYMPGTLIEWSLVPRRGEDG